METTMICDSCHQEASELKLDLDPKTDHTGLLCSKCYDLIAFYKRDIVLMKQVLAYIKESTNTDNP